MQQRKHLITARFGAAHDSLTIHLESGDQTVDLSKIKRSPTAAKERKAAISMVTEFWAKSNEIEFSGVSQLND